MRIALTVEWQHHPIGVPNDTAGENQRKTVLADLQRSKNFAHQSNQPRPHSVINQPQD